MFSRFKRTFTFGVIFVVLMFTAATCSNSSFADEVPVDPSPTPTLTTESPDQPVVRISLYSRAESACDLISWGYSTLPEGAIVEVRRRIGWNGEWERQPSLPTHRFDEVPGGVPITYEVYVPGGSRESTTVTAFACETPTPTPTPTKIPTTPVPTPTPTKIPTTPVPTPTPTIAPTTPPPTEKIDDGGLASTGVSR